MSLCQNVSRKKRRSRLIYHLDIRQSVKKYDKYAEAEHYHNQFPIKHSFNHVLFRQLFQHTHKTAKNSSVI